MIALKNILVPTDFSETSDVALTYARELASAFQSALHVLHVLADPYAQPWAVETSEFSLSGLAKQWEDGANERLTNLFSKTERKKLGVRLVTRLGHPVVQILHYAKDEAIDLIVMGTLGRGPVAHMLIGSVAEKVVRQAPCPVLTVRHPEHEFVRP